MRKYENTGRFLRMSENKNTEWHVEVARVATATKHPNADTLDLITLHGMGYTLVDRAGKRAPGDLVVYVAVDSLLPLGDDRWAFLRTKGKPTHRLKAARIRGIFSQGILTDAPAGAKEGDSVAAQLGIARWEEPERPADTGGALPRSGIVLPVYGVTSIRREPTMFEEGEPVVMTEKIHGCNARFGWVGGRWTWGSHRVLWQEPGLLSRWWRLLTRRGPTSRGNLWSEAAEEHQLRDKLRAAKGLVVYGEVYGRTRAGKRVQDLDYGRPCGPLGFAVFDVYDTRAHAWLRPHRVAELCADLGLEAVPVVYRGPYGEARAEREADGESTLYRGFREGVVVRAIDGRAGKLVGTRYLLRGER